MSEWVAQQQKSIASQLWRGTIAMMPLSIAVIPWGLLAGSYAVESGLLALEAQALSAILFAGAAQLVAIGMFKSGAGLITMLVTTFFITSRHLLYSVAMRETISPLPLRWRLSLGFLLTDELFALIGHKTKEFDRYYALGAGLSFYLIWNIASFVGIIGGSYIPNLDSLGLDFAIVATFIALVVPNIKSKPILLSVVVALLSSVLLHKWQVNGALVIASLLAMSVGYLAERGSHYGQPNQKNDDQTSKGKGEHS
ncbi:AzlC family ABC transporter permease [Vibrio genomosp. F10]|uniref:AzlC family ABC transporter permease n=1 Tax=Vibrio genomosp. F10 TaxID=723171 RepID=UPI000316B475|nr:AzlC family ABC transporter permease [Vibrio genomosp. F10]OEF09421.1 branched-chain amino acid ABC transporter permease [Vibrio genomosp. F10 str. 9ZB36]